VRRLLVLTARRRGVDPHLALAIGWQESGWQQRRRSSAGAIGVMQVLPGTGRWMSLYVDRRLNVYSLRDNVTAGVMLVKVLRRHTSHRGTIAAYYQGLGAMQKRGVYPSTRRYLTSVLALERRLRRGWSPL
jgi:soluble lytic murein transglycosylase-like protein